MSFPTRLSATAQRTGDSPISEMMARALAAPDLISLAAGFVDHATLPIEAAGRAAAALLADAGEGRRALQYGTTLGDTGLRELLAERLVSADPQSPASPSELVERMILTTGSQQLLYLATEVLVDPGDIVLVESPTYFVFLGVLESRGARVIGIRTDSGGMCMDSLEATLSSLDATGELDRVKLIYTISEHSNPTGLSLAADRRPALVELARRYSKHHRILILEDAAYRGLTFEGTEAPSVWSFDREGDTVILARTFSKTFSPGLKTGYSVVPKDLVRPLENLKGAHDFGSSNFNQLLLERVIRDGSYDPQVALLAATYRRKRDALVAALDEHLGTVEGVSWTHPKGGLYVWITFPEGLDTGRDSAFFSRCLTEGVLYVPGAYAYPNLPGPAPANQARLTFGVTAEPGLAEGVRRLSAALADCLDLVA